MTTERYIEIQRAHERAICQVAQGPLAATGVDAERESKLEAERVTWEFASRSARRLDAGKRSIEDSPLFGGDRQQELF